MTKSHYDTLGIDKDATPRDIKKAYRVLSLKYHPDHNSDTEAHENMAKINEAYATLNDESSRAEYDNKQNRNVPNMNDMFGNQNMHNGIPPEMANIFNNLFNNQMFNGMNGTTQFFQTSRDGRSYQQTFHRQQKPNPIEIQITLNIVECYNGKEVIVNFPKWTIMNNIKVSENTKIVINIPPGVSESDNITFENQGHILNDNLKGDIIVKFNIINNTEFKRVGKDLHIKRVISLKESLCGFNTTFTHLNGKMMSIKNVSHNNGVIVTNGYKKIATGLGMNTSNGVGNLVIEFEVEFPNTLSDDQINSIEKIL
jgi:DnaJ-class molecular chaperone